jgi:hypothetical protein
LSDVVTNNTHSRTELASLLSANLGSEKANELVGIAAGELQLGDPLTTTQCLDVLERIAGQPGLVGIAARFAKSRVLLRWGGNEPRGG